MKRVLVGGLVNPTSLQCSVLLHLLIKRVFLRVLNALPVFGNASLKSKETPMICPWYVCFNGHWPDIENWCFASFCECSVAAVILKDENQVYYNYSDILKTPGNYW